MTKAKMKALERVWIAEVENRLPLQSSALVFHQLHADGMVDVDRVKHGPVIVSGWCLTHAGRLTYCLAAGDDK